MTDSQTITRLVRQDADFLPLPALQTLSARIKPCGVRYRIAQVEALLRRQPDDVRALELYLHEFLNRTIKQMGGDLQLGPTFKESVKNLSDEVLEALPGHTRAALTALADMTPIPAPDARLLAHSLALTGALTSHFVDSKKEYRKLAMQYHPDRGGDADKMAELNRGRRK